MGTTTEGSSQMHYQSLLCILMACSGAVAQESPGGTKYIGALESELAPEFSISWTADLSITTRQDLPIPHPAGDAKAFEGQLKFLNLPAAERPIPVLLLESATRGAYLYADLDHDGRFSPSEEFKFNPVKQRPKAIGDAVFSLPLPNAPFPRFPVRVRLFPVDNSPGEPAHPGQRTLAYSFWAYATGTVEIDRKSVRVWCQYNAETGVADPRNGIVGVDLDGDDIMANPPSSERAVAKAEAPIFEVGSQFLSIDRIDPANRMVALKSHSVPEYQRISIEVGVRLPDFEFKDFQGRAHKLSEYAEKYVLLDFWGSWCGPCIRQFPHLKQLYADFRRRRLEIVGVNSKDTVESAQKCIADHGLDWVQATSESTRDLVEKRLRIESFPTLILLAPERRIVFIGGGDEDESLPRTLNRLLPATGRAAP